MLSNLTIKVLFYRKAQLIAAFCYITINDEPKTWNKNFCVAPSKITPFPYGKKRAKVFESVKTLLNVGKNSHIVQGITRQAFYQGNEANSSFFWVSV